MRGSAISSDRWGVHVVMAMTTQDTHDPITVLNTSGVSLDEENVKLGLVMKTAWSHQKIVEALFEKLKEHTQVRDQIRRAFVEELKTLRGYAPFRG